MTRSLEIPIPVPALDRQIQATLDRAVRAEDRAPIRIAGRGQIGGASYYHSFFEGRTTANGETFDNQAMTAASLTLDFGTRVRVTNLANSKSVVVTINDRGPYVDGRIIDLSRRAAATLGFVHQGVTRVRVEQIL